MVQVATHDETAVVLTADDEERLARARGHSRQRVLRVKELTEADIGREYKGLKWSPTWDELLDLTDDIGTALGAPTEGQTVILDSSRVGKLMQASHKPGHELARRHHFPDADHGHERIQVNCQFHEQLDLARNLTIAYGARPDR